MCGAPFNAALPENQEKCGATGNPTCLRFDNVDGSGYGIAMVINNISAYNPVWPHYDPTHDKKWTGKKGYLFNGRKSDLEENNDLVQINLCNDRHVKTQFCFVDADNKPVEMQRAAIRIFDLDHGRRGGPEAVQFKCTGGTFTLFGDHPKMVHSSYNAILKEIIDTDDDDNGDRADLKQHIYHCPDDEYITLWAHRLGFVSARSNP